MVGPGTPACDAPEDAPCRTQGDSVNAIQITWPERPYCPPVTIGSETPYDREVGCQVEVDIDDQTRIRQFQPIDWEDHIDLQDHAIPYKEELVAILNAHREAFAVDLSEIATVEGLSYSIDLRADAAPVNKRAYKMSPQHEEELDRQLGKLEAAGVIQPTHSMWGAPASIVYRQDPNGKAHKT